MSVAGFPNASAAALTILLSSHSRRLVRNLSGAPCLQEHADVCLTSPAKRAVTKGLSPAVLQCNQITVIENALTGPWTVRCDDLPGTPPSRSRGVARRLRVAAPAIPFWSAAEAARLERFDGHFRVIVSAATVTGDNGKFVGAVQARLRPSPARGLATARPADGVRGRIRSFDSGDCAATPNHRCRWH